MSKVATRKKNVEWKDSIDEGIDSARNFIASCTPEDLWWMAVGMMSLPSWEPCPMQDVRKRDTAKYKRAKKHYEKTFRDHICSAVRMGNLDFIFHLQGLKDGVRWSRDIATAEQRMRLKTHYSDNKIYLDNNRLFSYEPYGTATHIPATVIVDWVYTGLNGEEYMNVAADSFEFREFWTPFLSEPIEEVMTNLLSEVGTRGHKLRVPAYAEGFVDGALGLTQQLRSELQLQC